MKMFTTSYRTIKRARAYNIVHNLTTLSLSIIYRTVVNHQSYATHHLSSSLSSSSVAICRQHRKHLTSTQSSATSHHLSTICHLSSVDDQSFCHHHNLSSVLHQQSVNLSIWSSVQSSSVIITVTVQSIICYQSLSSSVNLSIICRVICSSVIWHLCVCAPWRMRIWWRYGTVVCTVYHASRRMRCVTYTERNHHATTYWIRNHHHIMRCVCVIGDDGIRVDLYHRRYLMRAVGVWSAMRYRYHCMLSIWYASRDARYTVVRYSNLSTRNNHTNLRVDGMITTTCMRFVYRVYAYAAPIVPCDKRESIGEYTINTVYQSLSSNTIHNVVRDGCDKRCRSCGWNWRYVYVDAWWCNGYVTVTYRDVVWDVVKM